MQRILDLDLDFFVQPVVFNAEPNGPRPEPPHGVCLGYRTALRSIAVETADQHEAAIHYLRERLGLYEKLPGAAVTHHGQVLPLWRRLINQAELRPPFHVTHVDAHADFGHAQISYRHVFDVLRLPPAHRPAHSCAVLTDGDTWRTLSRAAGSTR